MWPIPVVGLIVGHTRVNLSSFHLISAPARLFSGHRIIDLCAFYSNRFTAALYCLERRQHAEANSP
jgi:hypothetical protein